MIGRLPGEQSWLSLVRAVLDRASRGWRGVEMTPAVVRRLQNLRKDLIEPPRERDDKEVADESVTAQVPHFSSRFSSPTG
jgi:putative transposase